jgi:hypothetical protein
VSAPCTQILVSLKNADPTALTALTCLQRYLGFGNALSVVRRRVLWELRGPGAPEAGGVLDGLRRSGDLWNPNKETACVRLPGEGADRLAPLRQHPEEILALAWDPDRDRRRTPAVLRAHRSSDWWLARGTLWALSWREGDAREQLRWSEEAVVSRGPRQGLLVHPQLEDFRWIDLREPPPWLPEPD